MRVDVLGGAIGVSWTSAVHQTFGVLVLLTEPRRRRGGLSLDEERGDSSHFWRKVGAMNPSAPQWMVEEQ
jgi:hypothetical protein